VTDRLAVRRYRARLPEIDEELATAKANGDSDRVLELEDELEVIQQHIRGAIDLRGRLRPAADDDDRARQAVTKAMTRTIRNLWRRHPHLARHLSKFLRKGEFCLYDPEPPTFWVTA
jgi:hypothetical protein